MLGGEGSGEEDVGAGVASIQFWMSFPPRPALQITISRVPEGAKERADLKPWVWDFQDVMSVLVNWTLVESVWIGKMDSGLEKDYTPGHCTCGYQMKDRKKYLLASRSIQLLSKRSAFLFVDIQYGYIRSDEKRTSASIL